MVKKRTSDRETTKSAAIAKTDKKKIKKTADTNHTSPADKNLETTQQASSKSEIDDLFGKLKGTGNKKKEAVELANKEKKKDEKNASKKIEGSKDDIFGQNSQAARKRTEEGYRMYSEEELGFGKRGGSTPLCPFDCDCCF